MGCVTAKAWRISEDIEAQCCSISGLAHLDSFVIGGFASASAENKGGSIETAFAENLHGVRACCSLICTINGNKYIRVAPVENQWIDIGSDIDYIISSNTDWSIT